MPGKSLSFCGCGCDTSAHPTRRRFLATAASFAGAALSHPAWAQDRPAASSQAGDTQRIDVHHHLSPPAYIPELVSRKTGQRPLIDWTPQKSLDAMGRGGISTSMVSISEPGVWFGDEAEARRIARETNDWGAGLVRDYPGKFGLFASLPIPDIDASLREIEYSLDVLKADGICMMTSYGGKYLGDPSLTPVMTELNRRKAVVFTHPVRANCCRNLVPDVGDNTIELATDTARTIASLLMSGTVTRFPDVRFIFSHAGGTLPSLTGRMIAQVSASADAKKLMPNGPIPELQKLFYDTANAANPWALAPLLKLVSTSQIVYGSDFPFRSPEDTAKGLRDVGLFSAAELRAIDRENALQLLPRLRA
ncbi:MAG TPA: amidohydrolase family protein [Xanthobacteraceae bacterium]|nr:amidohydrolase family protein [Xanthobacteraceae bacterium]